MTTLETMGWISLIPAVIAIVLSFVTRNTIASLLPHFRSILNLGLGAACAKDGFLRRSLTTHEGYLTHQETSGIQKRPWVRPEVLLKIEDEPLDPAPQATGTKSDDFYPEFL